MKSWEESARRRFERLSIELATEGDRVLESLKDGVRVRPLSSPMASDSVVVLRPQLPPELIGRGLARALAHEGKPYDFDFDFGRSDRLVCTAVIYRAYDGLGPVQLPLKKRAGRNTLAASDLVDAALNQGCFAPVAAFVPQRSSELATGAAAVEAIRWALAREAD
jgi:hypothetical protein